MDPHTLSKDQVLQYHREGYLGPFTLCTPDEMALTRDAIGDSVLRSKSPLSKSSVQSRHLDNRMVAELCAHPAIVGRMRSVLGPDLILWRSNFFNKEPGALAVPWHQDINYWPIEPQLNISAWVAIDKVTRENSCVQLIPGSHKQTLPHIQSEGTSFGEEADPQSFDVANVVHMELAPGEFFLFTERLLHHSAPNASEQRRLGLAVRVTLPMVSVTHSALFKGHKNVLLSGEDRFGLNDTISLGELLETLQDDAS